MSSDFIYVWHKAGDKAPQKVKKYKAKCYKCGNDRGYVFKAYVEDLCQSCGRKEVYKGGGNINENDASLKVTILNPTQGEIRLKSSYELFYCNYLKTNNIPFLYEPQVFELSNGSTYKPDFYVLSDNSFVEIKGLLREVDTEKLELFKKDYPSVPIKLLTVKELIQLGYDHNNYKTQHVFNVLGKPWRAKLLDEKRFRKKYGESIVGMCEGDTRKIFLNFQDITKETISHEITHAYIRESSADVASLSTDQLEEIFCEIMGKYGSRIKKQTNLIYSMALRLARAAI